MAASVRKIVVVILAIFGLVAGDISCKGSDSKTKGDPAAVGAATGGTPTSHEGQAFLLGVKLAQAAMANGRAAADVVGGAFGLARTIADMTLHLQLAPLPTATGDTAKDGAAGMDYLLNGPGKTVGQKISSELGDASAATYELAVKLNMLPLLYVGGPDDSMATTMIEVFERLGARAKLPETALAPLLTKLKVGAPHGEVVDLVFDLNDTLPVQIGELYEKPSVTK